MARRRQVVTTVRVPARYVDNTTRQQARLTVESNLTVTAKSLGFRAESPREWLHGHERIGWLVDVSRVF